MSYKMHNMSMLCVFCAAILLSAQDAQRHFQSHYIWFLINRKLKI